jgi:hypothetical protein
LHWTGFKPDAFAGGLGEKTLGELDPLIGKYVVSQVGFKPTAVSFEVFVGSILFHIERVVFLFASPEKTGRCRARLFEARTLTIKVVRQDFGFHSEFEFGVHANVIQALCQSKPKDVLANWCHRSLQNQPRMVRWLVETEPI